MNHIIKSSCFHLLTIGFLGIVIGTSTVRAVTPMVAAGLFHSLILKSDSTLWACGRNNNGQLLDGTTTNRYLPVQVMTGVKSIAAGDGHSLVLKTDGTVWICGDNWWNELEFGRTPNQVMTDVQCIATGGWGSCMAIKYDNTLWSWGNNWHGQLGDGTTINRFTPVQVMENVHGVSVGNHHSLILKKDGTLWGCGTNGLGHLGYEGSIYIDCLTPVQIMTGVKSMAAGGDGETAFSLILKDDCTLWACGYNMGGTIVHQAIPVQIMDDVQSIAAGWDYGMFLKNDNTLWTCGYNNWYGGGQLGDGTTTDRLIPVQIMTDVQSMSAGGLHCLIIKTNGTLWACGYNGYGQIGDDTTTNLLTPIEIMTLNSSDNCITNLSARVKLDKIQLTWTDNGNSAYHIFRAAEDDSTAFEEIATRSGSYSTYIDIGLETGRRYWYKVFGDIDCDNPFVVSAIPESRVRR